MKLKFKPQEGVTAWLEISDEGHKLIFENGYIFIDENGCITTDLNIYCGNDIENSMVYTGDDELFKSEEEDN